MKSQPLGLIRRTGLLDFIRNKLHDMTQAVSEPAPHIIDRLYEAAIPEAERQWIADTPAAYRKKWLRTSGLIYFTWENSPCADKCFVVPKPFPVASLHFQLKFDESQPWHQELEQHLHLMFLREGDFQMLDMHIRAVLEACKSTAQASHVCPPLANLFPDKFPAPTGRARKISRPAPELTPELNAAFMRFKLFLASQPQG